MAGLLSDSANFSTSYARKSEPRGVLAQSGRTLQEFETFSPQPGPDLSLSSPSSSPKSASGKFKETLLDQLRFKPTLLETDINFSAREAEGPVDSMKPAVKNYLVADWDLTPSEIASKNVFLAEAADMSRWLETGPLAQLVPKVMIDLSALIRESLRLQQDPMASPSPSSSSPSLPSTPTPEGAASRGSPPPPDNPSSLPPGRGILHLLTTKQDLNGTAPLDEDGEEISMAAANYDYAMTFPRTIALLDQATLETRRHPEKLTPYQFDKFAGIFNHKPPPFRDSDACEICFTTFSKLFTSKRKTNCTYCGRSLCSACCQKAFVIPWAIVTWGDMTPRAVCNDCENHLQRTRPNSSSSNNGHNKNQNNNNNKIVNIKIPRLDLSLFARAGVDALGQRKIQELQKLRTRLVRWIYFFILPDCPTADRLLSRVSSQIANLLLTSAYGSGPLLSLVDVMELQTHKYLPPIRILEDVCSAHVRQCPHCTKVTRYCSAAKHCTQLTSTKRKQVSVFPLLVQRLHLNSLLLF